MRIWSYKGGGAWAEAIKADTFCGEAHTELQFDGIEGLDDQFFSSTLDTGPEFRAFKNLVSQDMNDWIVTDLEVTSADELLVYKAAQMIKKQGFIYGTPPTYNVEGIAKNFLPVPLIEQNPNQYFCSQAVVTACLTIGLFLNMIPAMMSPGDVFDWLNKHLTIWRAFRFRIVEGA
jgi:hypothetical protein